MSGIVAIALIVPVFAYRHYVQDKGVFPSGMLTDISGHGGSLADRKAGALPYYTLLGGVATVVVAYYIFWM